GGALDASQPQVLVPAEGALLVLDAPGQLRPALFGPGSDPDRDRVDEQTDHRLRAGNTGGTARHRGAEDHVVSSGVARDHKRPGGLDKGVDGDSDTGG